MLVPLSSTHHHDNPDKKVSHHSEVFGRGMSRLTDSYIGLHTFLMSSNPSAKSNLPPPSRAGVVTFYVTSDIDAPIEKVWAAHGLREVSGMVRMLRLRIC